MKQVIDFLKLILEHKSKLLLFVLSALVCLILIFPLSDLSDLVSSKVAQFTNNSIFLSFDEMKLSASPPGLMVTHVSVDTPMFSTLSAQTLSVMPSIGALIKQTPGGSLSAHGIFRGDMEVSISSGSTTENGTPRQKVSVSAQSLSLEDLRKFAQLSMRLKGRADLDLKGLVDFTFTEQPDTELVLNIQQFELPSGNVNTAMGPLTLPEIKLKQVHLKGRLSNGKFNIEEGVVGQQGDELTGTVKGFFNLMLEAQKNGSVTPVLGSYSLELDLNMKKSFEDRASLFLTFIEQFKSPTSEGSRYAFKLSATSPQSPPNMSALR